MAASREDLRDHLLAVLEAAPELPREDRAYLADTFLDELDTRFELVPKTGRASPAASVAPRGNGPIRQEMGWWPVAAALAALTFLIFAVTAPLLAFGHPPIFLLVIAFFILMRFRRPWMWHRRSYR